MTELKKYKIALFMIIRNSAVMPMGKKQNKTIEEIDKMSYETMLEVLKAIDYESVEKAFDKASHLVESEVQKNDE